MMHYEGLLAARCAGRRSNCKRRKIGAAIKTYRDTYVTGSNQSAMQCKACHRATCSAVHAEVSAIENFFAQYNDSSEIMFVWSEVPCNQCLSFIKLHSEISIIYCLTPASYSAEYPLSPERMVEIDERRRYAKDLGILITEVDREEVLQYELLKSRNQTLQPD